LNLRKRRQDVIKAPASPWDRLESSKYHDHQQPLDLAQIHCPVLHFDQSLDLTVQHSKGVPRTPLCFWLQLLLKIVHLQIQHKPVPATERKGCPRLWSTTGNTKPSNLVHTGHLIPNKNQKHLFGQFMQFSASKANGPTRGREVARSLNKRTSLTPPQDTKNSFICSSVACKPSTGGKKNIS
jgi:hypothetical protein